MQVLNLDTKNKINVYTQFIFFVRGQKKTHFHVPFLFFNFCFYYFLIFFSFLLFHSMPGYAIALT